MDNIDWFDRIIKLHAQTHLYCHTVFALFVVAFGWAISRTELTYQVVIAVLSFVGALQIILAIVIEKLYRLMRAALIELKGEIKNVEKDSVFYQQCQKLNLDSDIKIYTINFFFFIFLLLLSFSKIST